MQHLIEQLINSPLDVIKENIEFEIEKGYIGISELRKRSLKRNLTIEYIKEIEELFMSNKIIVEDLTITNKYLKKYIQCLSDFWDSYSYFNKQLSRGKFNLFDNLKQDVLTKGYSDDECAKMLKRLEDCWISSNQIYTKYRINQINYSYLR